jgi:hypothetical protein
LSQPLFIAAITDDIARIAFLQLESAHELSLSF